MRFVFPSDILPVPDNRPSWWQVLCGHMPYNGWHTQRINDAILQGVRPYKPEAAVQIGLVDELWDMLQRCWNEKREARPDLQTVRKCLDNAAPLWHARTHLPLPVITGEDSASAYTHSYYSSSPSPSIHLYSPPLPPSPSIHLPSPQPSPLPYHPLPSSPPPSYLQSPHMRSPYINSPYLHSPYFHSPLLQPPPPSTPSPP